MSGVILQSIEDVFQIEGKGTVVCGQIGSAWEMAQPGHEIVLLTPAGQTIRTAIKAKELFVKGVLTPLKVPWSGVLLADAFSSDELPRGTQMLEAPHPAPA
jgi:translation elongation factor EF-Tu-like GTPase